MVDGTTIDLRAIKISEKMRDQACNARRSGYISVGVTLLVSIGLLWLFFGLRFSPFPFLPGFSQLADPDSVLGPVFPSIVARLVERILATIVCIFVIQLAIGFCRYFFRLGSHLDMCANIVLLAHQDVTQIAIIAPALLPSVIDFGKLPKSPVDNLAQGLLGVVREMVARLPPK